MDSYDSFDDGMADGAESRVSQFRDRMRKLPARDGPNPFDTAVNCVSSGQAIPFSTLAVVDAAVLPYCPLSGSMNEVLGHDEEALASNNLLTSRLLILAALNAVSATSARPRRAKANLRPADVLSRKTPDESAARGVPLKWQGKGARSSRARRVSFAPGDLQPTTADSPHLA